MKREEFEELPGGLIIPTEEGRSPCGRGLKQWGALELTLTQDRVDAKEAFTTLFSLQENGRFLGVPAEAKARKDAILYVARMLLGDDYEREEMC